MNPNADYLGIVTMLRSLREQGLVSGSEAKKIAARLMVSLARTSLFLFDFSLLGIAIADASWYCVLLTGGDSK